MNSRMETNPKFIKGNGRLFRHMTHTHFPERECVSLEDSLI